MARLSRFESAVEIAAPVEMVYGFHLDTRNARLIAPAGTRVGEITGRFPASAASVVTMRLRQRPMPVASTWRLRIEAVDRPALVVDVAERSPFAYWRHEHRFEALGPARTRVAYRLRLGPLGRLADRLVVARRLARTFSARHALTRDVLEERARRGGVTP